MPERRVTVYIPAGAHDRITPGVAAVGTPIREWLTVDGDDPEGPDGGLLVIDYEATTPPGTFADAVRVSAERHLAYDLRYARLTARAVEMTAVAVYRPTAGRVEVADGAQLIAVARWVGLFDGAAVTSGDRLAAELRCSARSRL